MFSFYVYYSCPTRHWPGERVGGGCLSKALVDIVAILVIFFFVIIVTVIFTVISIIFVIYFIFLIVNILVTSFICGHDIIIMVIMVIIILCGLRSCPLKAHRCHISVPTIGEPTSYGSTSPTMI